MQFDLRTVLDTQTSLTRMRVSPQCSSEVHKAIGEAGLLPLPEMTQISTLLFREITNMKWF